MTTPGQTITTPEAVLAEIVAQLRTVSGLNEGNCYLIAQPMFVGVNYGGDHYVQVCPGSAIDKLTAEGEGFTVDNLRIVVFKRLMTDMIDQDTQKLTDATNGVLKLVRDITDKLTQNFLRGLLVVPLKPLRREMGGVPDSFSGWARIDRVFDMAYRINYSAPQSLS